MNTYLLIAIIVLVVFSAFFSATETAYTGSNRIKLKSMAVAGNKLAGKVLNLCENYDKLITTILIGNNIVNLTSASLSTIFFIALLKDTNVDAATISTVVMTIIILIFGEITPKFLAKTFPEKFAFLTYYLITGFTYLFYPLNMIFSGYKWLITKAFRLKPNDVVTEEEIMTIVEEAEEDGTLKKEETNLIRSVIEFDDLEVEDILIPRTNITAIDRTTSAEDVRKLFEKDGFSRLPIYDKTIDTIIGILHEKDFYLLYNADKLDYAEAIQPAYYTTAHVKISRLLKIMQKRKTHMAIVLDEYGGTLGLVTLEDILEELVGEIWDEHDEKIDYFKKQTENTFIVDAQAPLTDLLEKLDLPENDDVNSVTVSGWVIETCGEIPHVGKKLTLENYNVEVTKASNKKVLEIKVEIPKEQPKED